MGSLTNRFTKAGAVLLISGVALVGCSGGDSLAGPGPTEANQTQDQGAATPAAAASFANEFFAALIEEDSTDYSTLTPPLELTEAQAEQLMLDGKVDGVSDEELNGLVDYLYDNHKLGSYVYFADDAPVAERLRAISALIMAQSFAVSMSSDQAPDKIAPGEVTVLENEGVTTATFVADEGSLAPMLILVDGEWKVDGAKLLESFTTPTEEPGAPTEPSETVAP